MSREWSRESAAAKSSSVSPVRRRQEFGAGIRKSFRPMVASFAKLMEERESHPAGSVWGPEVLSGRVGPAATRPPRDPAARVYRFLATSSPVPWRCCPNSMRWARARDIGILAGVPIFSSDMSRLVAAYFYRSAAPFRRGDRRCRHVCRISVHRHEGRRVRQPDKKPGCHEHVSACAA